MGILAQGDENPFGPVLTDEWLTDLEDSTNIWDQSDILRYIAHTAAERAVSAWGLLLALQVHQMGRIDPTVVLVSRNGKDGMGLADAKASSIYAALLAETGGGKSDVIGLASALIQPTHIISDGTGQGIAKAFAETKLVTEDKQGNKLTEPYYSCRYLTHSVIMHCPEIDDLAAEFGRDGSKTSGTLRRMWVGEITGSQTGDVSRRVTLRPNTYRFGGIWGIQPAQAAPLLEGAAGGTPQRWCWAPAEEFREGLVRTPPAAASVFARPVWHAGSTTFGAPGNTASGLSTALPTEIAADTQLPPPTWIRWSAHMHRDIPLMQERQKEARKAVRAAKNANKLTSAISAEAQRAMMESHLVLTRIKLAAGMAFLHGRTNPDDVDWWAAGLQIEVSRRCLAEAWRESKSAAHGKLMEKGTDRGVEQFASRRSVETMEDRAVVEAAHGLWVKLQNAPLPKYRIMNGASKKQRQYIDAALELLTESGTVNSNGNPIGARLSADNSYYPTHHNMVIEPKGYQFLSPPGGPL